MKVMAELTDTFGGEANYSWVRRCEVTLPDNAGMHMILRKVREELGITGKLRKDFDSGELVRFKLDKHCICLFLNFGE